MRVRSRRSCACSRSCWSSLGFSRYDPPPLPPTRPHFRLECVDRRLGQLTPPEFGEVAAAVEEDLQLARELNERVQIRELRPADCNRQWHLQVSVEERRRVTVHTHAIAEG